MVAVVVVGVAVVVPLLVVVLAVGYFGFWRECRRVLMVDSMRTLESVW